MAMRSNEVVWRCDACGRVEGVEGVENLRRWSREPEGWWSVWNARGESWALCETCWAVGWSELADALPESDFARYSDNVLRVVKP